MLHKKDSLDSKKRRKINHALSINTTIKISTLLSKEVLPTKWFQCLGVHDAQKVVVMEYESQAFFCNYH